MMKRLEWMMSVMMITLLLAGVTTALAQNNGGAQNGDQLQTRQQDRTQDQLRDPAQDHDQAREQIRSRYMDRVNQYESLSEQDRDRMRQHLQECIDARIPEDQMETLFPENRRGASMHSQLQLQETVLDLAREGMPTDLPCRKWDEGMMKGAPETAVMNAAQRMGDYTRNAHQYMNQARQDGIDGVSDPQVERQLERGLAMNMWRGLNEDEMGQLRDHARQRLRDGSCDLVDLSAANETATELKELGMDSEHAVGLCGEALQQGYRGQEMRQIGHMFMAAHMNNTDDDNLYEAMHMRIQQHEHLAEMMDYMQEQGWMGPEEMGHDYGGCSPVDDVMWGGHHGDGDMNHDHGGMGGDGGGMGGGGGGDGGGMGGDGGGGMGGGH